MYYIFGTKKVTKTKYWSCKEIDIFGEVHVYRMTVNKDTIASAQEYVESCLM